MAFAVNVERRHGIARVQVSGPNTIHDFVAFVQSLAEETSLFSDHFVLMDLRKLEGSLDAAEQVFVGELLAHMLSHLDKLASLVLPEQITRNSERAAIKMGMAMRVFSDNDEAIDWLAGKPVPQEAASIEGQPP